MANSARYRGRLAYDGTRYMGFQRQANAPSIQAAVEAAIAQVAPDVPHIWGAGRTDSGVHASGQVIAFDCEWRHPTDALWRAINVNLPRDIALQDLEIAEAGFHPRFDAVRRTYHYQFYIAPVRNPVWDRFRWHIPHALDVAAMQSAADLLIGIHDFATFGQPTQGDVTIRELFRAAIEQAAENEYVFIIEGNAFLRSMVRSIMGTLVDVGRGKLALEAFAAAFHAADRSQAGATAPPHGLNLVQVRY